MPGTELSSVVRVVNKIQTFPALMELVFWWRRDTEQATVGVGSIIGTEVQEPL